MKRSRRAGQFVLALALLAMYAPMAMVFLYSFNESRIGTVWGGFSLKWYASLWEQRHLWASLRVSLLVGVIASTISVVFGLLAAIGVHRWHTRARRAAVGVLSLPLVIPDIILAISFALLFHAIELPPGLTTVILSHTAFGISYAFVVLLVAVQDFDENLYRAALDCGATPWQAFRHVVLPILAPSLIVAWLLVFALSFEDFLITFFVNGPGNDTLPIRIYSQVRFGVRPDTNALFVVLFVFTMLGVAVVWLIQRRRAA